MAQRDVRYARSLSTPGAHGSLFGRVQHLTRDQRATSAPWVEHPVALEPVDGAQIILEGSAGTYKALSTPDGNFELYNVEPGTYRMRLAMPAHLNDALISVKENFRRASLSGTSLRRIPRTIEIEDTGGAADFHIWAMTFVGRSERSPSCRCAGPRGRALLTGHGSVFTGTVTSLEYLEANVPKSESPVRVTFAVREVWTGPQARRIVLPAIYNRSCDGDYFEKGKEYVVLAEKVVHHNYVTETSEVEGVPICGGSRLMVHAAADVSELGPGWKPKP